MNSIFNTDRPRDYHTKWSKSEREISHDITYMWNLKRKNDANDWFTKQRDSQTQKVNLTDTKADGGGMSQKVGSIMYKIDEQQGPTVYSTGDYAPHSAVAYTGKASEKE